VHLHACAPLNGPPAAHLEDALRPEREHPGQIDWLDPPLWRIYLLGFGNVTRGDAVMLADRVRERVAGLPAPTVHLALVEPLLYPGDDSVWVGLHGDEHAVKDLATAMPRWVHEFGFVPDRRAYRPWVQLGRVTAETELDYLEGMLQRLGEYRGPEWTAEGVALGRARAGTVDRPAVFEAFDFAPFGP